MLPIALIYGFVNSVILALVALGFNLTFGISGVANFAYGALYIMGGLLSWIFLNSLGLPYFLSAIVAVLLTALVGALLYRFVLLRIKGMALSEVIATSALKASEGFSKLWASIVVVVGYGIAFYFLSLTLRSIPVGVAYAIWSGLGVVLIALVGWFAFGQKLDLAASIGVSLIVAGVVVMNVFSKTVGH